MALVEGREMSWDGARKWIIPGIAIGAAVGVAFAITRRRRSPWEDRWENAKDLTERVYDKRKDLVETGRDLVDRVRLIVEEGRKVVDEAQELWSHSRKLLRT